jgi:hypothetical protein
MHRVANLTYAGEPGELSTVMAQVAGSGVATIKVDGVPQSNPAQFALKPNAGDQSEMRITLVGAVGETCVVQISTVDGGSDGDFLMCQVTDPRPEHSYTFLVAPAQTIAQLAAIKRARGAAPATPGRVGRKAPGKSAPTSKGGTTKGRRRG